MVATLFQVNAARENKHVAYESADSLHSELSDNIPNDSQIGIDVVILLWQRSRAGCDKGR